MARKIKTANEMFDLLGSMEAGAYATVCHVDYVKIDNPKKQIYNPLTKRKNTVVDFETLGKNLGVDQLSAIISITRYRQLNWTPQNKLGAKYGAYRAEVNKIRDEFGVPEMKKKASPYQTMKFGNGISVGKTPNNQGKAYTHQNTFSANKDVTYYGVDSNGHVIKKFTLEQLQNYLGNKRDISGLNQLKKLTTNQDTIDKYIKRILDLKMEYTTFLNDRIIYMIGAANDEKFYFINDNLASSIEDIPIRPSEFMAIARATYNADYQIMQEQIRKQNIIESQMRKNTIRLTEAQLHKVIKESVKRVIHEMEDGNSIFDSRMKKWVENDINNNCKGDDVHTILNSKEWDLMLDKAPDPNIHRYIAVDNDGNEIILDCDENDKLVYAEYMGKGEY